MENYIIYPIKWDEIYQPDIQAMYQMFKDQESRIFSIDTYANYNDMLELIEDAVNNDRVFIVSKDNEAVATFILTDCELYNNIITKVNVHCAIRRKYWGKQSRCIAKAFKDYLDKYYKIKKLIASVPQCKYGIIKLLKDIGFKHEGTLKECLLFNDKNGNPKWYDELIYTSTRGDI